MRKTGKIGVLLIAATMALGMTACGGSENKTETDTAAPAATTEAKAEISGANETWGEFKEVFVPGDMTLTGGSQIDKESKKDFMLQGKDNPSVYMMFSIKDDEEKCKSDVETTKKMNQESNPQDVTLTAGSLSWSGVAYKYGGTTDCFQMYAKVGDKYVTVMSGYNAYDAEKTEKVLGSIKLQ